MESDFSTENLRPYQIDAFLISWLQALFLVGSSFNGSADRHLRLCAMKDDVPDLKQSSAYEMHYAC